VEAIVAGPQGFGGHARAEVRTPNAEVDHIGDGFAGVACDLTVSQGLRERGVTRQFGRHRLRNFRAPRRRALCTATQGHMQHRAVFGAVDVFAAKHGLRFVQHLRFFSQCMKRRQDVRVDALVRGIE
jgi:hypothetical protein